jgi:phospholipase C
VSWALADAYTTCDRWFCSVLGPTLPNRMYWHAATSNGAQANDEVLGGAFRGIDSIYHRLDEAGVDWAYYYGDIPVLAFLEGVETEGKLRRFQDFIEDTREGILPPVSYIDPAFSYNDDHPPHHPLLGQQLIASIYQALATSVHWNKTLLVVTYDENGGFYDHVPPGTAADDMPELGFDQLGFRVPALVIGPYVKQGYVSSVDYDHTSALKHLENEYDLAPLTARDAAANDLIDCIDLERLAAGDPRPPIELPPVDIDLDDVPDECIGGGLERRHADHDILEWARRNPEKIARWDRTGEAEEMIHEIAAYLESYGLGSIKRR